LTKDDVPLSEVNISLAETPYNVLAQTNVSGFFTALGVCAGQQELLATKAGFVPVTQNATVWTPTTTSITLKLEIAGIRPEEEGVTGGGVGGEGALSHKKSGVARRSFEKNPKEVPRFCFVRVG